MDVAKLLRENNITPKKELDQFFMIDEDFLDHEVKMAKLKPGDSVLEIGAGPGNLTQKIAKKAKVIAIEKDYAFRSILKVENANILFGDALEILESLRAAVKAGKPPMFNKVISNVPYSRTQDIIIELLQHRWDIAVLIIPKDVAKKLQDRKEKIALVLEDCCEIKITPGIPAKAFYPAAVDSSILVMSQKNMLDPGFWEFLKNAFKDRNKDAGKIFANVPTKLGKKKVHQLKIEELKSIYQKM